MTHPLVDSASSRAGWLAAAVAWCGSLAALVIWLRRTPAGTLREQLRLWQPWSLDVCVLLGVLIAVYVASTLVPRLQRRDIVRMAILAALALTLTLLVAPRTNRIFYDEQIYQGIGQNIADLRLAQVCHDGSVENGRLRCAIGEYNKQPYGYPHLLGLGYRVFGVHGGVAFAINAAAMALTACGVYLLVLQLFGDRDAAVFAGLLITMTPEQVMWSATAAAEPTASLAMVAAAACAAHYARDGRWPALALSVVTGAYAVQFRPESLLIVAVLGVIIWPRLRLELERPRGWWFATLFLWLVAVHLAHLFAVRHLGWGTEGARFSLEYLPANLRVNGWFYFYDERFPAFYTLLASAGLAAFRTHRGAWSMVLYFLLFFGIDLFFYAGSYNYGADVRYSLMTYPPIAVLGGLGAAQLSRGIARAARAIPARGLMAALVLFQFLWYAPVVRARPEEAWAARADVAFAEQFAKQVPRNAYVLTHNPGMFHLWGVNAGQMSLVTSNQAYLRLLADRYAGGMYLHWNFWCNVHDPAHQDTCRTALGLGTAEVVAESTERDQRFAFYRVALATAPSQGGDARRRALDLTGVAFNNARGLRTLQPNKAVR
jgi:hypothetical protein